MSRPDVNDIAQVAAEESREVRRDFRQTLLSGLALTVPFLITVLVLFWALGFVAGMLAPLADALVALGPGSQMSTWVVQLLAGAIVFGLVFLVGVAAQHGPDTHIARRFDVLMEDLPGIGSIYTSVERMSDVMVEGDTESFREVKIVEFPREDCFALAFLTASAPATIEEAADHGEMETVFVPMAPNPVMGGHLVNLPEDRIFDVDLSVEEGMQAVMTTGMAIDESVEDEGQSAD
ncbi:DUF502 domain-containing protein [Halosimplex pelagicum]|uniref:DUF502 domain-containing protein n=1 Tax=Halosimplex pelagicum TaxID=869886 RepID=A0A7D5TQU1_9EURY|nr:DUF502 domain-containing protein [Halosimplex pelagicum]QLH80672.1 DUF502 domain-containing protein [Halosimplex pelagicum]